MPLIPFVTTILANSATAMIPVAGGKRIIVLESSAPFQISFDGQALDPADKGLKFTGPFEVFQLANPNAVQISVTLLIGSVDSQIDVEDARPGVKGIYPTTANFLYGTSPGNTAWNQITGANANRVELIAQANPSNTGLIYFSTAGTNASRFCYIKAGDIFRINYAGPVWIQANPGTDTITVHETVY